MKKTFVRLFILAAACALVVVQVSTVHAQNGTALGNAGRGKAVYMKVGCYSCHGTVGQGGRGPRLAPRPLSVGAFTGFVRKPVTMPAFSAKTISDAELADIQAYLATIPAPPPIADIPLLNQ